MLKLFSELRKRGEQRSGKSIVAERLTVMRESINVTRAENKATAKLKRILPQILLLMTSGSRSLATLRVIAPEKVK